MLIAHLRQLLVVRPTTAAEVEVEVRRIDLEGVVEEQVAQNEMDRRLEVEVAEEDRNVKVDRAVVAEEVE